MSVPPASGPRLKYGLFSIRERMISLGGRLDLQTALGKGTKATLVYPITTTLIETPVSLETVNSKEQAAKPVSTQAQADSKLRLLIVDDHAMVRQGLCGLLGAYEDIRVVGQASNGKEAIESAHQLQPHVILMDITMPDIDGIEVTKRIKADYPHIVVVGMSVHGAEQVERAMMNAGAAAFINKEAAVEQLHQTILAVQRSTVKIK
jgi:CheY-like chemotaxis protein